MHSISDAIRSLYNLFRDLLYYFRSPRIELEFYRAHYSIDTAIQAMSDEQIVAHYRRHGKRERRFPNATTLIASLENEHGPLPDGFNEADYLEAHPDVRAHYSYPGGATFHYLAYGRHESRSLRRTARIYDRHLLNLMTNRIYDLPEVLVNDAAPRRVNVLVPAFDFNSMSAGFFGVFQVARFIAQCGRRVRLVMFDNFYWNEVQFREKLLGYPELEYLFDELEVEYIGQRLEPLTVSPEDDCVATVWYSAFFADKIMSAGSRRPFLYLIQDYESVFHPAGSAFALSDASYELNYHALFSTRPLQDYFIQTNRGRFEERGRLYSYFDNASACLLPPRAQFLRAGENRKKRFVLYARPDVSRNMFELAALCLCEAVSQGLFPEDEWEFLGVGIGDVEIPLGPNTTLKQLPRMNLKDYRETVATFDVGLTLMASPHPSLLPFDLAGSGAVVVTNSFANKQQTYFSGICGNIIARNPNLASLVDGLGDAARRVNDRRLRYKNAADMSFPRSWSEVFTAEHAHFIDAAFASPTGRRRQRATA